MKSSPDCDGAPTCNARDYVSKEEAAVLKQMRDVREEARLLQRDNPDDRQLEQLRVRFAQLKEALNLANTEKLRRLGHLLLIPLTALLLSACSGPTVAGKTSPRPATEDPAPATRQDPTPDPVPQEMPEPPKICLDKKIQGLPASAKLSQALLLEPAAIKGKKVTFTRRGASLSLPFSDLARTLHRFIAERKGARNFPEERALMAALELQAPEGGHITLDDAKPTWFKGSPVLLQRRINFLLADLVTAGAAVEINGKPAQLVLVEYTSNCGELCGAGGRALLLTDGCALVFHTVDWVS